MTNDKGNPTSGEKSSEGAGSSDTFTWDPRADQVFTPEDSAHNNYLVGKAASFDKDSGYDFIATGGLTIGVSDDGTTTWGGGVASQDGARSVIETLAPEGLILFDSKGKLVINDSVTLRINCGSGLAGPERDGMGLGAKEIEFMGAIEINNGSGLQVGNGLFSVSRVTLSSFISVDNGSTCRITPDIGERHITVRGVAGLSVGENSTAYIGGTSWVFDEGGMEFVLMGASKPDSKNYCYLYGFDFLKNPQPVSFNFWTKDDHGAPLKNNGEFVFAGIGDAFQLTAMFDRNMILIDNVPGNFNTIADDFTGGDLRIRVK